LKCLRVIYFYVIWIKQKLKRFTESLEHNLPNITLSVNFKLWALYLKDIEAIFNAKIVEVDT
jgi:hypothetical protein